MKPSRDLQKKSNVVKWFWGLSNFDLYLQHPTVSRLGQIIGRYLFIFFGTLRARALKTQRKRGICKAYLN